MRTTGMSRRRPPDALVLIARRKWSVARRWHWEVVNLWGNCWPDAQGYARSFPEALSAARNRARDGPGGYVPETLDPSVPELWPNVNLVPYKRPKTDWDNGRVSIWISFFDLDKDHPLGAPFESGYPNESLAQPDFGLVDLARPMSGFPQGWVRLSIDERPGISAEVMLSPAQVRALYEALGEVVEGSATPGEED